MLRWTGAPRFEADVETFLGERRVLVSAIFCMYNIVVNLTSQVQVLDVHRHLSLITTKHNTAHLDNCLSILI